MCLPSPTSDLSTGASASEQLALTLIFQLLFSNFTVPVLLPVVYCSIPMINPYSMYLEWFCFPNKLNWNISSVIIHDSKMDALHPACFPAKLSSKCKSQEVASGWWNLIHICIQANNEIGKCMVFVLSIKMWRWNLSGSCLEEMTLLNWIIL